MVIIPIALIYSLILLREATGNTEDIKKLFYRSGDTKDLERLWEKYKIPYDAQLVTSLRETFGRFPINVYKNDLDNHLLMAKGHYVSDGDRFVFFNNFRMSFVPMSKTMYVNLRPASMYLQLESALERIIMLTEYNIFRSDKTSSFISNYSPFSMDKVPLQGHMSIVAENCVLSGTAMVLINGPIFSLRHHNIGLKNCDFSVEKAFLKEWSEIVGMFGQVHITYLLREQSRGDLPVAYLQVPGYSTEPFIEPFFTPEQRTRLEKFMNNPIKEELTKHLAGALISLFNLTEPLQGRENEFKNSQIKSLLKTHRDFNKILIHGKKTAPDTLEMKSLRMYLKFNSSEEFEGELHIFNIKVIGLDTLHSTNTGGAFEDEDGMKIDEKVAFAPLLVTGKMSMHGRKVQYDQVFSVEINDLTADVLLVQDSIEVSVNFWKKFEITIPNAIFQQSGPLLTNMLIAYTYNMLPDSLVNHIKQVIIDGQKDRVMITKTTFDICKTTTIPTKPSSTTENSQELKVEGFSSDKSREILNDIESNVGVVEAKHKYKK